ncbi:MAG: alkaline ceramidase [Oscillospiraceae bacterium]
MILGASKLKITPQTPLRLCGYAFRSTAYDKVCEDIYLRVHIQKANGQKLVFIYADFLWWNFDFVKKARIMLKKEFGFSEEQVFFVASHNHSGPPTGSCFLSALEIADEGYSLFLMEQIKRGVALAMADMEQVAAYRYDGICDINVFRRKKTGDEIKMLPNTEIAADKSLTLLRYEKANGEIKAITAHYSCHANVANSNELQPDYAGIALGMLDEHYGGVSMFLQGCTADLRPANIDENGRFASGDYNMAKQFADVFYKACVATFKKTAILINEAADIKHVQIKLPLQNLKSENDLEKMLSSGSDMDREWAQKVLEKQNRNYETLDIGSISYGEGLLILTFNAEVSQGYAQFARNICPQSICVGYTNGMIGYLCSKAQINEGGYEPCGSAKYFALAGTFAPECEEKVFSGMGSAIIRNPNEKKA